MNRIFCSHSQNTGIHSRQLFARIWAEVVQASVSDIPWCESIQDVECMHAFGAKTGVTLCSAIQLRTPRSTLVLFFLFLIMLWPSHVKKPSICCYIFLHPHILFWDPVQGCYHSLRNWKLHWYLPCSGFPRYSDIM